jgi:hypothetical protein
VYRKDNNSWQAQITLAGQCTYLGCYTNKHDAARKYNEVALSVFGVFAVLNEIKE